MIVGSSWSTNCDCRSSWKGPPVWTFFDWNSAFAQKYLHRWRRVGKSSTISSKNNQTNEIILNQFEMRNEKKLFQNYLCVELYWFCLSCGNLKTRDWAWTKHLLRPLIYTEGRKDKTIKIVFFKSISSFRNLVGLIVKLKRLWTDGK